MTESDLKLQVEFTLKCKMLHAVFVEKKILRHVSEQNTYPPETVGF